MVSKQQDIQGTCTYIIKLHRTQNEGAFNKHSATLKLHKNGNLSILENEEIKNLEASISPNEKNSVDLLRPQDILSTDITMSSRVGRGNVDYIMGLPEVEILSNKKYLVFQDPIIENEYYNVIDDHVKSKFKYKENLFRDNDFYYREDPVLGEYNTAKDNYKRNEKVGMHERVTYLPPEEKSCAIHYHHISPTVGKWFKSLFTQPFSAIKELFISSHKYSNNIKDINYSVTIVSPNTLNLEYTINGESKDYEAEASLELKLDYGSYIII